MQDKIKKDDWKKYVVGPEMMPEEHLAFSEFKSSDKNGKICLEPIKILTTKDDSQLFFRTFSFVDKLNLNSLTKIISEHKKKICDFIFKVDSCKKTSQHQIIDRKDKNSDWEFLNLIELKAIGKTTPISFKDSLIDGISRSSVFKNNKSIDISKFYDSFYTHSLAWIDDKNMKEIFDELDEGLMKSNGNITNGIPTGPITSKIISEILLSAIMIEIDARIKNIECFVHRFADDFTIYYDKEEDFINISKIIANILNKYKLSINKEKFISNYKYENSDIEKIKNYAEDEKWSIKYNAMWTENLTDKEAIDMAKIIVLDIVQSIDTQKNKSSFYKWILKAWNNEESFLLLKSDDVLLDIFMNFAINNIIISDLGLNVPFNFLRILKDLDKEETRNKYINKISAIYNKTTSQMKKIFIFDFLYKNNWHNKIKINYEKNIYDDHFLHITQLLEAKKINFENDIKEKYKEPTINYKRVSKEWILWMYASESTVNEIKDGHVKEKMKKIIKMKDSYKPFEYY